MSATALNPYLTFGGNTREAMTFYQSVLGGELTMQTFGEVPGMPAAPGWEDKIMHARLEAGSILIMASECQPGGSVKMGDNITLSLVGSEHERLTAIFNALSEGGTVAMPLAKQFWGDTFGQLTDRFGVQWMVNITDL